MLSLWRKANEAIEQVNQGTSSVLHYSRTVTTTTLQISNF